MAKQRAARHVKSTKQPVTINLEAVEADKPAKAESAGATPSSPQKPAPEGKPADSTASKSPSPAAGKGDDGKGGAPKTETPKKAPETKQQRSGFSPMTAIAGGVVALAGAAGLQWAGLLAAPGAGTGSEALSVAVSEMRDRVTTMEQSVSGLPEQSRSLAEQAVSQALSKTGEMSAAVDGVRLQLEAIDAKVAGLEKAISGGEAGDTAAISRIASRLDALETTSARLEQSVADAGAAAEIAGKLTALETQLLTVSDSAALGNDALSARIDDLAGEVSKLSAAIAAQSEQPRVARAIAAAALKSAIDRGLPFMSELETYAAVANPGGAPDPNVEALSGLAAAGVPTVSALQKGMAAAADSIIAAANSMPEDAGVVDRLFSSARSLVKVRPVGEVEGESVAAIVARMEAALGASDLETAVREAAALPDIAKPAAADLVASIRARMTANAIVAETVSGALAPGENN